MNIPYLSTDDLLGLNITTIEVIASTEAVIRGRAEGRVWSAPKAVITTPSDKRYMMAALAAMDGPSLLAVKTVVMNPDNTDRGISQINGLVTMLDSVTGLPVAILDGNWITAVRTAGLSATAAKYMANADSSVIGFVGCGVQAQSHLDAFAEMFPLKHVKYFGRGQTNQDKLAKKAQELGLTSESCASGQAVVEGVDLLVTTVTHTSGAAPFLDAAAMKKGAFAAIVDLAAPWHRSSFSLLDSVIIDDLEQEASLPNKLCEASIINGDISNLVLGEVTARMSEDDRTAFIFRGHALGDLALSVLAVEKYQDFNQ